jgi:large subunit ribosomal protein L6
MSNLRKENYTFLKSKKNLIHEKKTSESYIPYTLTKLNQICEGTSKQNIPSMTFLEKKIKPLDEETVMKIPSGVEAEIRFVAQKKILFLKGIRGLLFHPFPCSLLLTKKENKLSLICTNPGDQKLFSLHRKIVYNMIVGVTKGYTQKIKTVGVGYRGNLETNKLLSLSLGYSHPIYHLLPASVKIEFSRKNNKMNLSGPSLPLISGNTAAIHRAKIPDIYNGKGVRYRGVKLGKKEGKKPGR